MLRLDENGHSPIHAGNIAFVDQLKQPTAAEAAAWITQSEDLDVKIARVVRTNFDLRYSKSGSLSQRFGQGGDGIVNSNADGLDPSSFQTQLTLVPSDVETEDANGEEMIRDVIFSSVNLEV